MLSLCEVFDSFRAAQRVGSSLAVPPGSPCADWLWGQRWAVALCSAALKGVPLIVSHSAFTQCYVEYFIASFLIYNTT